MSKHDTFDAWAPPSAIWSVWAKPVLFSQMDANMPEVDIAPEAIADVTWAADSNRATAIVVDLPGAQGVMLGLSLADVGYRPVPLYNACPAPAHGTGLVEVYSIMAALASATLPLLARALRDDTPPAFLLDANRNTALVAPSPGRFDNRSISLPTDFPSANLLLSRGIRRVILVQRDRLMPQADVSHSLLRWQEAQLPIFALSLDAPTSLQPITIRRPKAVIV